MQTGINQKFNQMTKSNLEIKLQNDIIAFKKVLKWAKTIRNRIETSIKQLDGYESYNEPHTSQKVIHNTKTSIEQLDESCSNYFNWEQNVTLNRTKEDEYPSNRSENQLLKNDKIKINVQDQSSNLKKVEISSRPVKSSKINLTNVKKMVDLILSQRLSGFSTRIDEIESKFVENHKKISIINNDLAENQKKISTLINDLIFLQTNLNELDEDVKEMVIETNNISAKIENIHIRTYRELERILNFLRT
ncbi:unnamed protein product [Brachionus calyciflorus]|uniref:Uncharacterized protein n=1 Tax=Brachionus calyciflorus TaxID=104777 RepID=A0A813VS34_9BILA|nr:unnamed protein product [Brachionus calyciflorus]